MTSQTETDVCCLETQAASNKFRLIVPALLSCPKNSEHSENGVSIRKRTDGEKSKVPGIIEAWKINSL